MKDKKAPILILDGSKQPYLSIGCYSGGIKAFGYEYLYIPPHDAFLRTDYIKEFNRQKKSGVGFDGFVEYIKNLTVL